MEYPRLFNEEKNRETKQSYKSKQKQISMTSFKHEQKNDDEVNFAGGVLFTLRKKIVSISILNRLEVG